MAVSQDGRLCPLENRVNSLNRVKNDYAQKRQVMLVIPGDFDSPELPY
jgi:hypothetical protein